MEMKSILKRKKVVIIKVFLHAKVLPSNDLGPFTILKLLNNKIRKIEIKVGMGNHVALRGNTIVMWEI